MRGAFLVSFMKYLKFDFLLPSCYCSNKFQVPLLLPSGKMKYLVPLIISSCHAFVPVNVAARSRIVGKEYASVLKADTQAIAEKVLTNPQWPAEWPYTKKDLTRMDDSNDSIFYESPRLVTHIADATISALTDYYSTVFEDGDDVLDICSSWISHYPKDWKGGNVVGLGMNQYELENNKALSSFNLKDLNEDPTLPYDEGSFDKVTCVVSVDYLTKPKEVFEEIGRVLKPGGKGIISISNRCFPTKAWNLWLQTNDLEHVFITASFFHYSGAFDPPACKDISPNTPMSDPIYVIHAAKKMD